MTVLTEIANTPAAWSDRADAGESWERCGWSQTSQSERFRIVAADAAMRPGDRVLDFGCGDGAFADLVPAGVEYLGYDWAHGMVDVARRHHSTRRFTTEWPSGTFDTVVCIGTFNLPGSKQETWHTLRHLWDTTGCATLVVSLYAGDDERCLVYDEADVTDRLGGLSHSVVVERWRPNDILAVIRR